MIEHLHSKGKPLSSNPSIAKLNKNMLIKSRNYINKINVKKRSKK
jgi:hypothetical protein